MTLGRVHTGDVMEYCATYEGERYHALLCDPPYELAFMGRKWDSTGIAFQPSTWAALAGLLHPGAFLMAFAGTRGYHRMACAMEDAGLIIHPALGWAFGSGFPKATRVKGGGPFAGHRYGLQALKPAFEFIAVAQVPYQGRPVDSITRTGAGALNVDGGRIGMMTEYEVKRSGKSTDGMFVKGGIDWSRSGRVPAGRWPSNLLLSHAPGCNGVCVDGCAVKAMGEQSGERPSAGHYTESLGKPENDYPNAMFGAMPNYRERVGKYSGDTGTAARFFHNSDWALENSDPFLYVPKAARRERDAGLEGMPLKELRPLGLSNWEGQTNGSGETMGPSSPARNPHPTVKPLRLTQHLAALLLPPAEYVPRRLLVPFVGSGSEMIGAMLAGWDVIDGIEREAEYAEIARARLAHWETRQLELSV